MGLSKNQKNIWQWLDNSTLNDAPSMSWCFNEKRANYLNMCAGVFLEDDGCVLNWPCEIPMPFGFICEYGNKFKNAE